MVRVRVRVRGRGRANLLGRVGVGAAMQHARELGVLLRGAREIQGRYEGDMREI